ncbi:transcriptional regulator BetI [Hyphomonas jannaschiana]|uniref:TetR family transcriptional regulator n=1 Tax=Hyphomonas jannaschiana VP2 TaxID=1280952 RepID=A0A059FGV4_9PROT|nr:transcriptional regulator BetI [Hyphomonas jannaschiana]KCZ89842.1 TetR family transcriptional regulator [Hyphomonas jannaschiana VP2]
MGRAEKKLLRKQSLIEATIICVNKYGYAESTIQRIAAVAGLTGGTIYRHFDNKHDLFEATMRHLLKLVLTEEQRAVAVAQTDTDRLKGVISSKFAPALFNSEFCTVWLHFWAHAQSNPGFSRIERLSDRLLRRSLNRYAKRFMPPEDAEAFVSEISLIVDGLWIAHAQRGSELTSQMADEIAQGCLRSHLQP